MASRPFRKKFGTVSLHISLYWTPRHYKVYFLKTARKKNGCISKTHGVRFWPTGLAKWWSLIIRYGKSQPCSGTITIPSASGHKFAHGQLLLEIYWEHGLGYLRPLLVKMAANPAIMYFLDGHHSHKDNPNENFPRELLELFTLGEGQYTEKDVYEAARAFTGRRFDHQNYPYAMYVDEEAFDLRDVQKMNSAMVVAL